jgi:hypothetical protein
MWLNVREPVPVDGSTKGKGEGTTIDNYFADIAIAWCRNRCNPDPVRRIWASNELIYQQDITQIQITADNYGIIPITETELFDPLDATLETSFCESLGSGGLGPFNRKTFERAFLTVAVPALTGNIDTLAAFVVGPNFTISGSINPSNDGTYDVISITDLGVSGGIATYRFYIQRCFYQYLTFPCIPDNSGTCGPFIAESGTDLDIVQDIAGDDNIYFPDGTLESYNGDPGTDNLAPDPYMASILGDGNVPAFRGTTYTVITNMNITKWAGTVPRFEAEIRESIFRTVQEVVDEILIRTETLGNVEFDTSGLAGSEFVEGFLTVGPFSPSDTLRRVMDLYGVVAQQTLTIRDGLPITTLAFYLRQNLSYTQLAYAASSAREMGSSGDVHALVTRGSRRDIPQEFVLEFFNADRDMQIGTTSYTVTTASVRNTQKINVPIVFTAHDADLKARFLLWRSIYEHDSIEGVLPPTEYALQAGDRVEFTGTSANPIRAQLTDVSIGENGLVEFKGRIDDELVDNQAPGGDDPPPLVTIPPTTQQVDVFTMDLGPLSATQASTFGLQFYVLGGGPSFPSSAIYISKDRINWTLLRSLAAPAVAGVAITALAPASPHFWDTVNTVQVTIRGNALLWDDDEESVASGTNWALLGNEVIGFTTATLIETGTYELSGLLRGRNDTSDTNTHNVGEAFVMLPPTGPNVVFDEISSTFFKVQTFVRAVPSGTTLADAEEFEHQVTPQARTLQPYRVHGIWATRQSSEDLCLFVTDRVRAPYRLFSALVPPQVEEGDAEDFLAEVYWDSDPSPTRDWELVRTLVGCRQVNGQISFNYTRNQQITDFHISGRITDGSFPDVYRFLVYRKSDTIGEGRIQEFCAAGYGFMPLSDCEEP